MGAAWGPPFVTTPRYGLSVARTETEPDETPPLASIELFTGAGGLAQAIEEVGKTKHLLAVEIDRRACETLRLNGAFDVPPDQRTPHDRSGWPLREGDIHKVSFTEFADRVDIVAGGVPCQPWSLGGAHRGFDDSRNLWPELFRTIRETRPRAVIAENVKGLLRPSFKEYYDYILDSLRAPFVEPEPEEDWHDHHRRLTDALASATQSDTHFYNVKFKLMNAADYGVPQQRWRVFVVAFRRDLGLSDWMFPEATHSEAALFLAQRDGTYWERHNLQAEPPFVSLAKATEEARARQPWLTLRDAIHDLPEPLGHKVDHPDWTHHFGWGGAREYPGHTPNLLDRPAKTVKAGVHGVPGGESVVQLDDGSIRYMTVRETARVMTFPDKWQFSGPRGEQMRQLGNAVPVHLGWVVANSVAAAVRSANTEPSHPRWRSQPADAEWRAPTGRSRAEATAEQDLSAGAPSRRLVSLPDGRSARASIELKKNPKARRIYANLRYSVDGKTVTKYVGEVSESSRLENLQAAWKIVHAQAMLGV